MNNPQAMKRPLGGQGWSWHQTVSSGTPDRHPHARCMGPTTKERGQKRGYVSFRIPEAKHIVSAGVCVELLETDPTRTQMKEMRVESC
jgi:hypothetical protein